MSATAPPPASEEAERTARHLRLARQMSDLAMDLACAAAARAKRDLAADTEPQLAAETPKPALRKTADASTLFTRLCRIVEIAVALEARLAKGLAPAMPKTRPAAAETAPALPLPRPPRSPQAAALAASTSLASPATPPWQPKQSAPHPAVSAAPLNGTGSSHAAG